MQHIHHIGQYNKVEKGWSQKKYDSNIWFDNVLGISRGYILECPRLKMDNL